MGQNLLNDLNKVEQLARATKLGRLLYNPVKYIRAMWFRQFVYPKSQQELVTTAPLFFGPQMTIALPASTDIYLTGGKSHDSEVRLARFIILNLSAGDQYLDIGAHYGYFTLLAAHIASSAGRVIAFEPSSKTYPLLLQNTRSLANVTIYQKAVSDTTKGLVFYEFPNQYSEYNSADVSQFENEAWFKESKPKKVEVASTTIDELIATTSNFLPKLIKIDVEGAEYSVMQGALNFIKEHNAIFIMEYLAPDRHNTQHVKATQLLQQHGYKSYIIQTDGTLQTIAYIDSYLTTNRLESDNIVFKKG